MKSAIRIPNLQIWPLVRFWLIKRPLRPLAFQDPSAFIARKLVSGSPSGHPQRQNDGSERAVAEALAVARKLFREARRASPQRQNNGARASDGAGLPWLSRKLQPSPGKLFRDATGQLPAPKLRKRARATRPSQAVAEASTVAEKVFSGSPTGPTPASKRRERAFGQPDRPDPSPNLR